MGLPKREKYNQEKIEKLRKYLETYAERGQPIDYEIIVDDFKAVRRTDDPNLFNGFADFMTADTKSIEILFYTGTSNNNDKYIFTFQDETKDTGLSGLEIENKIQEQVNRARREWDFEQLKKDNEEWKEYADELEGDIEKLEKQLEEVRSNQSPLHGFLGEFGSSFVSGMVKQNPKMLEKIPGLAGLVEEGKAETTASESEPTTFTPSTDETENLEAKEALSFIRYLKKKFNQEQFGKVMTILDLLTEKPEKVEDVLNQLKG